MIPKHIQFHWFWDGWPKWVNVSYNRWRRWCRKHDWHLYLYTEIPNDMPCEYREVMEGAPHTRFRADLVRYWLMYRDGGIYIDADTLPGRDFTKLLSANLFLCTIEGSLPEMFFMGSAIKHSLWKELLDKAQYAERGPRPEWWFFIRNLIPDVANRKDITFLDNQDICGATRTETEVFCRTGLGHCPDGVYLKHFCEFAHRVPNETLKNEQANIDEYEALIKAMGYRPKREVAETPIFHAMPSGDLVCDPGGKLPDEPPRGYYRDENQLFRFHPKPKQPLAQTVKQGVEKRKKCPTCGKK